MKLFSCTDHDTHWPVGGASIVLAENQELAMELLDAALMKHALVGFKGQPYTLVEIDLTKSQAVVLNEEIIDLTLPAVRNANGR